MSIVSLTHIGLPKLQREIKNKLTGLAALPECKESSQCICISCEPVHREEQEEPQGWIIHNIRAHEDAAEAQDQTSRVRLLWRVSKRKAKESDTLFTKEV